MSAFMLMIPRNWAFLLLFLEERTPKWLLLLESKSEKLAMLRRDFSYITLLIKLCRSCYFSSLRVMLLCTLCMSCIYVYHFRYTLSSSEYALCELLHAYNSKRVFWIRNVADPLALVCKESQSHLKHESFTACTDEDRLVHKQRLSVWESNSHLNEVREKKARK